MPTVFFGHGSPMNTLERNRHPMPWAQSGRSTPRPRGILGVSAHWYIRGTAVTAMPQPGTIHDFGGFPQALFEVQYPAPGDPALASRIRHLLAPTDVTADPSEWGLDHGTWSVLKHVYPRADIPVVQLASDSTKPLAAHYELAKRPVPLRDEGVLVVGSGNVVHNLGAVAWAAGAEPYPSARSIPTPEHYLPLLYVIALQQPGDRVEFSRTALNLHRSA